MTGKVWALKAFMEELDVFIDVLTTREPGTVIYEDGHQIVAKPLRGAALKS
jgi:hypothetical protein